jgi:pimeloyl-ACP methyl ester carboxylesterase
MVAPHTQHQVDSGDVRLSCRLFGTPTGRNPVLFVHGLSYFSYDWVDFGSRLCRDRAGCAMDMRGFGDSAQGPELDYSVPVMASDIGRVLDQLGWRRAILVAHSMGGRSAAWFASKEPSRVSALVLIDWSPENSPVGSRRVANTVANVPDVFASVADAMAYFGVDGHSPAGATARERFEAYLRPVEGGFAVKRSTFFRDQFRRQLQSGERPKGVDLWAVLADLSMPTLVLRATRSDLFDAATLPRMLQANPRIAHQEIEGGHNLAGENADATLTAIRGFIDALEKNT